MCNDKQMNGWHNRATWLYAVYNDFYELAEDCLDMGYTELEEIHDYLYTQFVEHINWNMEEIESQIPPMLRDMMIFKFDVNFYEIADHVYNAMEEIEIHAD